MELLKEACITSKGRGKLQAVSKHYAFHYESKWVVAGLTWALSLEVPLRGEESLLVTKKQQDQVIEFDQFYVTGSLAQQLDESILGDKSTLAESQKRQHKERADQLLELLGHFLDQWYQFQRESLVETMENSPDTTMSFQQYQQLAKKLGIEISQDTVSAVPKINLSMRHRLKQQLYELQWVFSNQYPKELSERNVYFDHQRLVLKWLGDKGEQGQDESGLESLTLELYPQECFF